MHAAAYLDLSKSRTSGDMSTIEMKSGMESVMLTPKKSRALSLARKGLVGCGVASERSESHIRHRTPPPCPELKPEGIILSTLPCRLGRRKCPKHRTPIQHLGQSDLTF